MTALRGEIDAFQKGSQDAKLQISIQQGEIDRLLRTLQDTTESFESKQAELVRVQNDTSQMERAGIAAQHVLEEKQRELSSTQKEIVQLKQEAVTAQVLYIVINVCWCVMMSMCSNNWMCCFADCSKSSKLRRRPCWRYKVKWTRTRRNWQLCARKTCVYAIALTIIILNYKFHCAGSECAAEG